MKRIVIISFTDVLKDPRVNRQIRFLKEDYEIVAIGEGNLQLDNVKVEKCLKESLTIKDKIVSGIKLLSNQYENYYWSLRHIKKCADILNAYKPDYIIANDIDTLPVSIKHSNGAKVLFDAHEYSPRQFEDRLKWRIFLQGYMKYLCKQYIPKADMMTTVCDGIAKEYSEKYNVNPTVITNSPDYEALEPSKIENKIRIIHHGIAISSRKIENMINMMEYLDDRFELNLMLVANQQKYYKKLKQMASGNRNIKFLEPVPMREISKFINQFDMGLFLLEPVNFNYKNALPNKFFEYVQGRLAIAIGPSPEMKKLIDRYDLGVVSEDFTPKSLANVVNSVTIKEVSRYKKNANDAAFELSAKRNKKTIKSLLV
ncbi:hypothetical protein GLW20_00720 [Virgibacillus halodenitrificans]|nr:hypothetical protein [Virgibacillus halodenitrificans]